MTPLQSAIAWRIAAASRTSSRSQAGEACRSRHRTSRPDPRSARASGTPINPVAPVTSTRLHRSGPTPLTYGATLRSPLQWVYLNIKPNAKSWLLREHLRLRLKTFEHVGNGRPMKKGHRRGPGGGCPETIDHAHHSGANGGAVSPRRCRIDGQAKLEARMPSSARSGCEPPVCSRQAWNISTVQSGYDQLRCRKDARARRRATGAGSSSPPAEPLGRQQRLGPAAQGAAQPGADRHAEAHLGPLDQARAARGGAAPGGARAWMPARTLERGRQAPGEFDDPMVQQRHARSPAIPPWKRGPPWPGCRPAGRSAASSSCMRDRKSRDARGAMRGRGQRPRRSRAPGTRASGSSHSAVTAR